MRTLRDVPVCSGIAWVADRMPPSPQRHHSGQPQCSAEGASCWNRSGTASATVVGPKAPITRSDEPRARRGAQGPRANTRATRGRDSCQEPMERSDDDRPHHGADAVIHGPREEWPHDHGAEAPGHEPPTSARPTTALPKVPPPVASMAHATIVAMVSPAWLQEVSRDPAAGRNLL